MTTSGLKIAESLRSSPRVYQRIVPDGTGRHHTRLLDNQYLRLLLSKPRDAVAISMGIRFRSAFDPDIAQATWGELIDRHPGLRLCLELPERAAEIGAGRASILENVEPPAMTIEDLRPLARDEREIRVRREFERLAHVEWQFDHWPLHHFSLLCVADDVLHLFFGGDHAISDGLSEVLVLGEFLEIYTARLQGRAARLAPSISAREYDDTLARIGRYQPTAEELALVRIEMERPPEYSSACLWNPNLSKASSSTRLFEVRSETLDAKATSGLLKKTVELNCSLNSVLLAAFLRTMAVHPHPKSIAMLLSTSGTNYPDAIVDRVFAGFSQVVPADFEVPGPDERIEDVLAAIHAQAHKKINSGLDRALARVFADNVKKIPLVRGEVPDPILSGANDIKRANIYFSFLGHVRFDPAGKAAEVTSIRTGGTNPAGSLECQFMIFGERLMLFFVFDSRYFDAQLIERFLGRFAWELETFSHSAASTAKQATEALPTPVGDAGKVATQLLEIAGETMHRDIAPDQLSLDMEGELGIDSLLRVRLAIQLYSRSSKRLDRDELLACRTLAQMVSVIGEQYPDGFADS